MSDALGPPSDSPLVCECGHPVGDHDPIAGCLTYDCPCTPAETIERLARGRD